MSIILEQLTKRYDGQPVVNNVSLEVAEGELFVLLGSSGSGKTTVLSMVAGLVAIDAGRVLLHGRDVTHLPAQERNVGFVFQNYALFQHMTVADNIEFGLRVRKTPAAERQRRRDELLEMVGLAGLGARLPRQLSGGQQQRVALARALAHRPDVLLLDEPLGALDAKIRVELRRTLRAIQQELGLTTILVTHDQEEAFELGDRIGVMSFGRLLEIGAPEALYRRPQTEFVATFLGAANLLLGQLREDSVQVGAQQFALAERPAPLTLDDAQRVQVLFRPENVVLARTAKALDCPPLGLGEVEQVTFSGSFEKLRVRLPPIPGVRAIAPPVPYGGSTFVVEAMRNQARAAHLPLAAGDAVWVGVNHVHVLTHPGLRFLILSDGSTRAQAAVNIGGQIAKMAHARVVLLGYGMAETAVQQHLQASKEQIGSGLAALDVHHTVEAPADAVAAEVERQALDLIVLGNDGSPQTIGLAEQIWQVGVHHLLLIPAGQAVPQRALICVARGEPGKEDVLFAGRLLRHLGARATLLTILPEVGPVPAALERTQHYLDSGVRTLDMLGVPAETAVHVGPVYDGIFRKLNEGGYDLLVLGAPLPDVDGKTIFNGLIGQVLHTITNRAALIVRSSRQMGVSSLLTPRGTRSARELERQQSQVKA